MYSGSPSLWFTKRWSLWDDHLLTTLFQKQSAVCGNNETRQFNIPRRYRVVCVRLDWRRDVRARQAVTQQNAKVPAQKIYSNSVCVHPRPSLRPGGTRSHTL